MWVTMRFLSCQQPQVSRRAGEVWALVILTDPASDPPRCQSETNRYARKKGPEPGESPCFSELCRIGNLTERAKAGDSKAKTYQRKHCGHDHCCTKRQAHVAVMCKEEGDFSQC